MKFANFLLPPLLKKISVIHYLHSLAPIPVSEEPFAVVAEPTPVWIAVPSLVIVTITVLIIASFRIRWRFATAATEEDCRVLLVIDD